jgi:hypothetical protein
MKRVLAGPIALLSTACVMRPFTPSVSVEYWSEDSPAWRQTAVPPMTEAMSRWMLPPQNPWSHYSKLTLLSALDGARSEVQLPEVSHLDVVADARVAATRLAAAGLPADTLWIIDLRGAASVAFGATLSELSAEPVAPVLTFNNWPSNNELVPAEETLAALVQYRPQLPRVGVAGHPVFLLDAWRLAYRYDQPDDDVVDNRYMLSASDFPDGLDVVEDLDETDTEEDDLNDLLTRYHAAGVGVSMVDLGWLSAPDLPPLREYFTAHTFVVERRETIVTDPHFYRRSHGGFGGMHTGPSPFRPGGVFHGGGG